MKNLRLGKGVAGWRRWPRQALLIFLLLVLPAQPAFSGPAVPSSYDSLRLFTEALFEISQKYVHPQSEEKVIYGSLRGLMNSLDPDSSFLTPQEYQNYLNGQQEQPAEAGLDLIIKDNLLTVASVLDGSPGAAAGLLPGDHIIKIDGQLVHNLTTQEAARKFRGPAGTTLKLQVVRSDTLKPLDITLTLKPLGASTVTYQVIDNAYAYIRVRFFNNLTPKELTLALKALASRQPKVRGLILDLRNNSRGSLEEAVRTASIFLGDQEVVSARGRSAASQEVFNGKRRDQVLKTPWPTVVLVDRGTARASEIVAAALHDQYRATLLGARTLGLCGLTKVFPLQDGSALVMTVAQCYTPRGQKIQGKGLEPQIEGHKPKNNAEKAPEAPVKLAPAQDPWVQQAVEVLKGEGKNQIAQKAEG